jgi:hypothetical protein
MLSFNQVEVIESPITSKLFLSGPAGTGKTTCGFERASYLIKNGIPASTILVLTPQRTLQDPYTDFLKKFDSGSDGEVAFATIGGLARRMVDLFWPLVVEKAGFAHPDQPPLFLTLETAQYHMARIVKPRLEEGWFSSVVMDRNRLFSQILDNLNKSAAIGFPYTEIGNRLANAWSGDPAQRRVYADTQACANDFRKYCFDNNFLDFSLQLEIFSNSYWKEAALRDYLHRTYRHIIYDNIEEDIPIAHDILRDWLPELDSALLIYDQDAGYRRFLGADAASAMSLAETCEATISFDQSYISNEDLSNIASRLSQVLAPIEQNQPPQKRSSARNIQVINTRFFPEMLNTITAEIQNNILNGTPPSEIVVLSPYLSDALRFSLSQRLENLGIPVWSHRPSRSLNEEPACLCLLTLAKIAHPHWGFRPPKYDVVQSLLKAFDGMDLVRATLLGEIVYRTKDSSLGSFERINPEMQERISYVLGGRYEFLRIWLDDYRNEIPQPLDHFLSRLFGEVLSQPGFNFHRDIDSARVASSLIESVKKFRVSLPSVDYPPETIGKEYIEMLEEGVIAAQFVSAWREKSNEAVQIAPAYTFLMSNRPATVQYWLDVGSSGWYERLFQPLTHPYVLSRGWPSDRLWRDDDEVEANNGTLAKLTTGLIRRCREKLYLCISEFGESGYEQRGILLRAFNQVLSQNE